MILMGAQKGKMRKMEAIFDSSNDWQYPKLMSSYQIKDLGNSQKKQQDKCQQTYI